MMIERGHWSVDSQSNIWFNKNCRFHFLDMDGYFSVL